MKALLVISALFLMSCTDANKLSWTTLGSKFEVTCYSGGKLIYKGETTGQHSTSEGGTFFFKDVKNKAIEINGNCIFSTDAK
jgi:hypothetical protein